MQGKFQMQVLPAVGHTVHEDSPDKVPFSISIYFNFTRWPFLIFYSFFLILFVYKVAEVLATFLVRNKLASATEAFQPVGVVDRIPLGGFPMAPPTNNPTAGIGIKPAGLMPPPPPPV